MDTLAPLTKDMALAKQLLAQARRQLQALVDLKLGPVFASRAEAEALSTGKTGGAMIITVIQNGHALNYVYDAAGTALTTGDGKKWSPAVDLSVWHWGADPASSGDDSAAFLAAATWALAQGFHREIKVPAGRYRLADTLRLDPSLQGGSTTLESVTFRGEGARNGKGTDLRFSFSDAGKNGLEVISGFQVVFADMMISGEGDRKSLVVVDALDAPGFAGHLARFENVQFRNFGAVCAEGVVWTKNAKTTAFDLCYFGAEVSGETVLRIGGNAADDAAKNHIGVQSGCTVERSYVFGQIKYRNWIGGHITTTTFIEDYDSGVAPDGDGLIAGVSIHENYFANTSIGDQIGLDLKATATVSGRTGGGAVTVWGNTFRRRRKAIRIDGTGPVLSWGNTFELVDNTCVGYEIAATAENVFIGKDDDRLLKAAGAKVINDLRHSFGTSQPTENVGKSIVLDAVLAADDTSISANNTAQVVLETAAVKLRGGLYRVRCMVNVRCTDATDDLPFQVIVRHSPGGGDTNIGLIGFGTAPSASKAYSATTPVGTVFMERIVYLPADAVAGAATTKFRVVVRNCGAGTPATGWVEGASTELTDSAMTWLQVEEWKQ